MLESILKKCQICAPARARLAAMHDENAATIEAGGSGVYIQAEIVCDYCGSETEKLTQEGETMKYLMTGDLRKRIDALEQFAISMNEPLANKVGVVPQVPL